MQINPFPPTPDINAIIVQAINLSTTYRQSRRLQTAVELWKEAEKARSVAKQMTSFAALSLHGAAFAQLQCNARVSALWDEVECLEQAAIDAYEAEIKKSYVENNKGGGFKG